MTCGKVGWPWCDLWCVYQKFDLPMVQVCLLWQCRSEWGSGLGSGWTAPVCSLLLLRCCWAVLRRRRDASISTQTKNYKRAKAHHSTQTSLKSINNAFCRGFSSSLLLIHLINPFCLTYWISFVSLRTLKHLLTSWIFDGVRFSRRDGQPRTKWTDNEPFFWIETEQEQVFLISFAWESGQIYSSQDEVKFFATFTHL